MNGYSSYEPHESDLTDRQLRVEALKQAFHIVLRQDGGQHLETMGVLSEADKIFKWLSKGKDGEV